MLNKNTVIDLWHALEDTPFVERADCEQILDDPDGFMGFPYGTTKGAIWDWFDQNYKQWGGLRALLEDDPQPERKFSVHTPAGVIECYAKHETDSDADFPGIYVDIRYNRKQLAEKQIGDLAAVVEYDSCTGNFQTVTYRPGQDEPVSVEVYDREEESVSMSDLETAYAKFKLEWMLSNDIKLDDICNLVQKYIEQAKISADFIEQPLDVIFGLHGVSISDDFKAYLEDPGFGGMLWPSFEKWLESGECPVAMTYGAFFEKYKHDICFLDVYDENGNEITDPSAEVPLNSVVMSFSRLGDCFEITVRLPKETADAE